MNVGTKKYRTISIMLIVILALTSFVAGCGKTNGNQAAKKEIVIGCVGAMTGPNAQLGNNLKYGVTVAADEINAKGGINGAQIRLVFRDDEADPTKSLNLTRELVTNEKIDAFIGPVNTTCAKAIQPYLNQNKIIQMNGGCTGATLIDEKQFPYTFRTHINDRQQAIFMVQNAVKAGYKRIAMVHDTSALGTGAKADMEAAFKELGVQPVTDVSYNAGDVDMLPAAQKLKESKADMCLFFTLAVDGARIVKAMEKIDYLPPKTAIHGYTCLGQPAFRELGGTAANGVLCNTPTKCAYKTGAQPSDRVLNIAKAFEAKFGADATNQVIYATALAHYDCVYILKEAIEKAGSTDADKVKAAIESISKYDGANSDYTFGPNKHDGNDIANLSATVVVKNTKGCFELAQ